MSTNDHFLTGPSPTQTLAETVGVSVAEFVEAFGAGWQYLPDEAGQDFDSDPSGMVNLFGPWFASGEPLQLALRPTSSGVELGVPVGRWVGHGVMWQSHHRRDVRGHGLELLEAAPPVVREVLRQRRSSFRYCRYCRRLTPPEQRLDTDTCYGCGTEWLGIVY